MAWLMASDRLTTGRPATALCTGARTASVSGQRWRMNGLRMMALVSSKTNGAVRLLL